MKPVLGVLGGMGALAGVDFMQKLITLTNSSSDQGNIPAILYTASKIPSRLDYLYKKSEIDPFPAMLEAIKILENTGVSHIVIACNTAHYWFDKLQPLVKPTLISIIDTACDYLVENNIKKVGIMATDITNNTGLYSNILEKRGIEFLTPDAKHQSLLMEGIYAVKGANLPKGEANMLSVYEHLLNSGAEKILMSCTEVPIGLAKLQPNTHLLDATDLLASKCVKILTLS